MPQSRNASRTLLLRSRIRNWRGRVLWGWGEFYGDRLRFRALTWRGWRSATVPLSETFDLRYHPLTAKGNVTVYFEPDERLSLHIDEGHHWRLQYESWLTYSVNAPAKIIGDDQGQASTMSG